MNTRTQLQAGRSSFHSLAILFGLALLSFSIFAAPPNAPFFTALDDQELSPPSPDGRYSLNDAIRGLPFTVDTPTPPQITAEQVVTPSTLGNYINTPGMRLILEPGNYGNLSIGGTDKEIVLTTGVIVNILTITGQRIVVRGNPARTGTISRVYVGTVGTSSNFPADVLLDGVYADSTEPYPNEQSLLWVCNRVAIINSRLRTPRYAIGSFPHYASGATNLIIANSELVSWVGQSLRMHSTRNFALVDNRIYEEVTSSSLRLHSSPEGQKSDNIYVGRNQFEGGFWQIRPIGDGATSNNTPGMGSVWVENNNVYSNALWWINMGEARNNDFPEVFTQRNNNAYISSGGWRNAGDYPWTATIENNTVQGYVAPPAWEHQ